MVYLYTIYLAFLNESTYRANVIFTVLRDVLMLFIMVSVWTALYEGRGMVNGQSLSERVLYVLAVHACKNMTRNGLSDLMHQKISTGKITNDFIRPVSIMLSSIADQLGRNLFRFIFSTVPVLVAGIIVFHPAPVAPINVVVFIFSILLGMILMLQLSWIISLLTFWTKNGVFGRMFIGSLIEVFGGTTIPLWVYPGFMQKICSLLPFSYMFFYPVGILMGKYGMAEIINIFGIQLLRVGIMIGIERLVWHNARKVVTVQGG
jgi:ABC-2 type transport system permease protein